MRPSECETGTVWATRAELVAGGHQSTHNVLQEGSGPMLAASCVPVGNQTVSN